MCSSDLTESALWRADRQGRRQEHGHGNDHGAATGHAAAQYAGPAIVLSLILAGLACAFSGLCYAEFASMIPIAGSAYTYAYATFGELIAWIIGWSLILEYSLVVSAVAVGWSGYAAPLLLRRWMDSSSSSFL